MKVYKFLMSCGHVGSEREAVVEFEDATTEEEVQEAWKDWVFNFINGSYHKVEQ